MINPTFPVMLPLGPFRLHPHWVFEALAYFVGFRIYLRARRRRGDPVPEPVRWTAIAAAAAGAAIGSKLLALAVNPAETLQHWNDLALLMGGKTVVGGLIGGLIAVELVKRQIGERRSTGDLFVFPLVAAIAIGRIGCFLTGLPDRTYGQATVLPWGVDFGDGVPRHPTQLYEIAFLVLLGFALRAVRDRLPLNGDLFKLFMVGYMSWRLAVGFIQPEPSFAGLSTIQWAAAATLAFYAIGFRRRPALAPAIARDHA